MIFSIVSLWCMNWSVLIHSFNTWSTAFWKSPPLCQVAFLLLFGVYFIYMFVHINRNIFVSSCFSFFIKISLLLEILEYVTLSYYDYFPIILSRFISHLVNILQYQPLNITVLYNVAVQIWAHCTMRKIKQVQFTSLQCISIQFVWIPGRSLWILQRC